MKKGADFIIHVLLLVGIFAVVGLCILKCVLPDALPFKELSIQTFTGVIASLFAVALLVERAVEVVVMVFRDYQADMLEFAEATAKDANTSANNILATNPGDSAAKATVEKTKIDLDAAHRESIVYKAKTKEIAISVGFILGALVSIAGVRALHGLLADNATPTGWFNFGDIIITSAMLAGGSEGIHRIANAFTSTMDNLSDRADQDVKKRAK